MKTPHNNISLFERMFESILDSLVSALNWIDRVRTKDIEPKQGDAR